MSNPHSKGIFFINRKDGSLKKEQVYGEHWLRWTYGNPAGRMLLMPLTRRWFISWYYGRMMSKPRSRRKIAPFIRNFELDTSEFLDPPESFRSFNEFFYRKLKPSTRPVDAAETSAVLPADGRHMAWQDISAEMSFMAKGQSLNLPALFDDAELASVYEGGSMMISRLCPVDYHRFHFPCAGTVGIPRAIRGGLSSVNPIALMRQPSILWENKRVLTFLASHLFGQVAFLEIGATMVGSLRQTFIPETTIAKGQEKGFFAFGGSCVILLFEPGRIRLDDDLVTNTRNGMETYAHIGETLGTALHT